MKDDPRYMSDEVRIAEGYKPRHPIKPAEPRVQPAGSCRCGKSSWASGSGANECPQCGNKKPR